MYFARKQRVIDILLKEFGGGWFKGWALKYMGKTLNWRGDKLRSRIKELPKDRCKGGRPVEVD